MRKLFFFIAALCVTCAAFAADQYPDPATSNSLSNAISAVGDGEVVWLDDAAPYINAYGVDYTKLRSGKHITIKAIEGKKPIIRLAVPFQVREAVNAKFIGVKFEGDSIKNYSYLFDMYDGADNVLEFEDCEFTNLAVYVIRNASGKKAAKVSFDNCYLHNLSNRILNQGTMGDLIAKDSKFEDITDYAVFDNYDGGTITSLQLDGCEFVNLEYAAIHNTSTSHISECIVNDCYFHDSKRTAIFFEAPTSAQAQVDDISITNSTFANYTEESYYASIIDIRNGGSQTALGKVLVDHCTFYNNRTVNTDHTSIRVHKSTDVVISNCIFVDPTEEAGVYERSATHVYGGQVKNCIAHNYLHAYATKDGHWPDGASYSDNFTSDPLFVDAANADYSLGTSSPARWAATDGTCLGDPRWWAIPKVYTKGAWDSWAQLVELELNDDKKSASATLTLPVGNHEFLILIGESDYRKNGAWLMPEGPQGTSNVTDNGNNMRLWAAYNLEHTITWTYATNTVSVEFPEVTVYFVNEANWEDVKAYAWRAEDRKNADWPGVVPTKEDMTCNGHDVYSYNTSAYNTIIFSDNGNDSKKTGDLPVDPTKPYYYGGDWHETLDCTPTAVEKTEVTKSAQKLIENGQIVIIKNGVRYSVLGQIK